MPPVIEQLTAMVKPEVASEGGSEGLIISIDEKLLTGPDIITEDIDKEVKIVEDVISAVNKKKALPNSLLI